MTSRALDLSRNGKTETSKSAQDKGHRREMELTVDAMKQGKDAPIPFEQIVEVTEATFAIEEAIRTQRTVYLRPELEIQRPVETFSSPGTGDCLISDAGLVKRSRFLLNVYVYGIV